jgi:malic enzyme
MKNNNICVFQVSEGCVNTKEDAINLHRMLKGKIEIHNKVSVENAFDEEKGTLGLIYTPGVAYVATEISNNKELENYCLRI